MRVGCLVKLHRWHPDLDFGDDHVGIVVEVINSNEVPPVCKILWETGEMGKEWTDELQVFINKND